MPRAFIVAILAARVLSAQDESSALLARAREKILDSLRRLPKYTCLETIDRTYYAAPRARLNRKLMTESPANACGGDAPSGVSLDAKDRLRVEVVVVSQRELLSWPGASRFDTSLIDQMIPLGPISTGSFGIYLLDVFANPKVQFTFTGKRTDGKRDVFEYSYTVPVDASHMKIKGSSEWRATGYSGSFEVNTGTAELAKLVITSDALPPDTGMCYTKTALDYHFTLIGDDEFLIPLRSELETFDIDGRRTDSVTGFPACHEFTAESSLRFDEQSTPAISAVKTSLVGAALPPGLSLTLGLMGSIDSRTAAAGDPVSAKVESAVKAPGSNEVLVPAGTICPWPDCPDAPTVQHLAIPDFAPVRYRRNERRLISSFGPLGPGIARRATSSGRVSHAGNRVLPTGFQPAGECPGVFRQARGSGNSGGLSVEMENSAP
ncbi:MAG: hypothetical protein ABSB35_39975 [Bryobacteraceae bacterium]